MKMGKIARQKTHFYRPDWKYQFCVYAECPYQPGKLTALDAVLFQVKGVDDEMAVFRVEKNRGYTVMSNHHLRNKDLSLKAKGFLSQMLSLPENWDYTLKGLSLINRESIDAIRTAVWELEKAGYITRQQNRDGKGKMADMVYTIYEQPQPRPEAEDEEQPGLENPVLENPTSDNPTSENLVSGNPMQLNKDIPSKEKSNTDLSSTQSIPRDMVSEYQDDLRNGIAWLAFWREGRSWQAETFHLDLDDTLYPEDRARLTEIQAADPQAVVVNGYYSGYLGEEMNVAELAAGVRHHYDNGLNNIAPFMEAHSDELPPDVLAEAREKAHAAGLPFYERPYRGDDIDPYLLSLIPFVFLIYIIKHFRRNIRSVDFCEQRIFKSFLLPLF